MQPLAAMKIKNSKKTLNVRPEIDVMNYEGGGGVYVVIQEKNQRPARVFFLHSKNKR